MSPKGGSDSRRIPRIEVSRASVEVKKQGLFSFLRRPIKAHVRDISATGAKLRSNNEVRRGDIISGTVAIPEADLSMKFKGSVRWTRKMKPKAEGYAPGYEFGIQFVKVSKKDLSKIEAIRKLLTSKRYRRTKGRGSS